MATTDTPGVPNWLMGLLGYGPAERNMYADAGLDTGLLGDPQTQRQALSRGLLAMGMGLLSQPGHVMQGLATGLSNAQQVGSSLFDRAIQLRLLGLQKRKAELEDKLGQQQLEKGKYEIESAKQEAELREVLSNLPDEFVPKGVDPRIFRIGLTYAPKDILKAWAQEAFKGEAPLDAISKLYADYKSGRIPEDVYKARLRRLTYIAPSSADMAYTPLGILTRLISSGLGGFGGGQTAVENAINAYNAMHQAGLVQALPGITAPAATPDTAEEDGDSASGGAGGAWDWIERSLGLGGAPTAAAPVPAPGTVQRPADLPTREQYERLEPLPANPQVGQWYQFQGAAVQMQKNGTFRVWVPDK